MESSEFRLISVRLFGTRRNWATRAAEAMGVDSSTVRRWATGRVKIPHAAVIILNCLESHGGASPDNGPKRRYSPLTPAEIIALAEAQANGRVIQRRHKDRRRKDKEWADFDSVPVSTESYEYRIKPRRETER
jgi:hypothetical protein